MQAQLSVCKWVADWRGCRKYTGLIASRLASRIIYVQLRQKWIRKVLICKTSHMALQTARHANWTRCSLILRHQYRRSERGGGRLVSPGQDRVGGSTATRVKVVAALGGHPAGGDLRERVSPEEGGVDQPPVKCAPAQLLCHGDHRHAHVHLGRTPRAVSG